MRERMRTVAHTLIGMKAQKILVWAGLFILLSAALFFAVRALCFPRPYREEVEASGLEPSLVYAVIKAESGFDEKAVSRAGAVGLMQLLPSTAQFVCTREGLAYDEARLTEGAYNLKVGCLYLNYLLGRFSVKETALAAYNAGEGVVAGWLKDPACSADGIKLTHIPYPETAAYLKKIGKIKKFYDFFY